MKNEASHDIYSDRIYRNYVKECDAIIKDFKFEVESMQKGGNILIGYGAPAKGNTLLNASKVKLDFIIDDNPLKQGLYTPGMNIPIFSSEKLNEYADADNIIFVPLAWNFFEEIRDKIKKIRPGRKDGFMRYFPYVYTELNYEQD
jgi:hypothetical protein